MRIQKERRYNVKQIPKMMMYLLISVSGDFYSSSPFPTLNALPASLQQTETAVSTAQHYSSHTLPSPTHGTRHQPFRDGLLVLALHGENTATGTIAAQQRGIIDDVIHDARHGHRIATHDKTMKPRTR